MKAENPWWKALLCLFIAFVIFGATKYYYREVVHKEEIPIETTKPQWQPLGPSTMIFDGQRYSGDVYFDRMSIERKEGKVILWMKTKTHSPIIQHRGKKTYKYDEQIARWILDCAEKKVKMDYIGLYFEGKKLYGGKMDDVDLPIMKDTTSYAIYESFCF